ncbi:MAG: DNA-processing protein DprA [Candidatus Magnetoovum sp. WYHC-5]|nr:DNA-processing protein DprA [Candidatus Magnetoovum sp. WYHC-5]
MNDELKSLIALSTLNDIGPGTIRKLLTLFGTADNVFKSSIAELMQVEGVGKGRAESIATFNKWSKVDKIIERLEVTGAKVITSTDGVFPELLREIPSCPVLLYVRGDIKKEDHYAFAVVGSRKASHYGISVTEKFTRELSEAGFTIVSGLARGIDSVAHRQAIKSSARTIAVLGCGVDIAYPPENANLMERIVERGAVVSEYPPGTRPHKEHFPIRNRIISGLSLGVLVTEATKKSGSLITASIAIEQNREVFAVPGNIMSPSAAGAHNLIKSGAKLVQGIEDIINELSPLLKGFIRQDQQEYHKSAQDKSAHLLNEDEQMLCKAMSLEPTHIDDITRLCGMPTNKALSILLNLELRGIVKQVEGMNFLLIY